PLLVDRAVFPSIFMAPFLPMPREALTGRAALRDKPDEATLLWKRRVGMIEAPANSARAPTGSVPALFKLVIGLPEWAPNLARRPTGRWAAAPAAGSIYNRMSH